MREAYKEPVPLKPNLILPWLLPKLPLATAANVIRVKVPGVPEVGAEPILILADVFSTKVGVTLNPFSIILLITSNEDVTNPAFDVTPARLVTGIITERGLASPQKLIQLFE